MRKILARYRRSLLGSFLLGCSLTPAAAADRADFSLGTAFSYQGRLQQAGEPAEGRFDLAFELYGAAQGGRSFGEIIRLDVAVRGGSFVTELDFGQLVFAGEALWLEIDVRPAGEGSFTALEPRQRLAGEGGSLCTVDSDVRINGTLGVGVTSVSAPLHLPADPDAEPGAGGVLVVGPTAGRNLAIDSNEIMARNAGLPTTLYLNNDGGTVEFGGPIDIGYQIVEQTLAGNGVAVDCPAGLRVLGGGCASSDSADHLTTSRPFIVGARYGWLCTKDQDGDESLLTAYAICARVQ